MRLNSQLLLLYVFGLVTHEYEQHYECKHNLEDLHHQVHTDGVERKLALVILGQMDKHRLQPCTE